MSIEESLYTLKYNCIHEFELNGESSQDLYNLVAQITTYQALQKKWSDSAISIEDEARRRTLRDTIFFCPICEEGTTLSVMTLCQRRFPRASSSSSCSSTPSELPVDPSPGKETSTPLCEKKVKKMKNVVNEEDFPLVLASLQSKAFEEFTQRKILNFIDEMEDSSKRLESFRQIISAPKPPYFWTAWNLSSFLIKSVKRGDKAIVEIALQHITQAQKERNYDWDRIFFSQPTWKLEFKSFTEEKTSSSGKELEELYACTGLDSLKDQLEQQRKRGRIINVKKLIQVYHEQRDILSFIVSSRMYSQLGGINMSLLLKDAIEKRYPQIDLLFTPLTMHYLGKGYKSELETLIYPWIVEDQTILSWVSPLFSEFSIALQQDILTSVLNTGNLRELNRLIPLFWKNIKQEEEKWASTLAPLLLKAEQMGVLDQIVLPLTRSDRIVLEVEIKKVSFPFSKWLHDQSMQKTNEKEIDPDMRKFFVFPLRCNPCGHSFSAQALLQMNSEKSINRIRAHLIHRFREGKLQSVRQLLKNCRKEGALTSSLPQCPLCSQKILGWVSLDPTSLIKTNQGRIDLDFLDDTKRALLRAVLSQKQDRADLYWETIAKDQGQGLFFESILPFLLFSEIESMQQIFAYFSSKDMIPMDHLDLLLAISGLQGNEPSVRFLLKRMKKVQGEFVTFLPEIFDLYEVTYEERELASYIEKQGNEFTQEELAMIDSFIREEEELAVINSFLKDDEEEPSPKRQKTDP